MELCFDREHEAYFTGQMVTGKLMFNLAQPISGQLTIRFQGESKTSFAKNVDKKGVSVSYGGRRSHLDEIVHSSNRIYNSGKHEFPIMFHLPDGSPGSYEGPYGYIRYWCKALFVHSEHKRTCASRLFTVILPLDLNTDKTVPYGVNCTRKRASNSLRSSLSCVTSQKFQQMQCSLAKYGYVPGETVNVYCSIDNQRRKPLHDLKVTLKQMVKFSGQQSAAEKEATFCIASLTDRMQIQPYDGRKCHAKLKVPPLPPTLTGGQTSTNLIEIKYAVEIKAGKRLIGDLPIVIGTVPMGMRKTDVEQMLADERTSRKLSAVSDGQSTIVGLPQFENCFLSNCQTKMKCEEAENCANETTFVPKCVHYIV